MVAKTQRYHSGLIIKESLSSLQVHSSLMTSSVATNIAKLKDQIHAFQIETIDYSDDSSLSALCKELRDDLLEVSQQLAMEEKDSLLHYTSFAQNRLDKSVPISNASKLILELPLAVQLTGQIFRHSSLPQLQNMALDS